MRVLFRTRRGLAAIAAAAAMVIGGGVAYAATSGAPPVTSPTPTAGPYYSGPVHECVSASAENRIYVEEHSNQLGNCARGYLQLAVNELTPAFQLQLGSTVYNCTTSTAGRAETLIVCPNPAVGAG